MVITLQIQYPIQKDLTKVNTVCCAAARGSTLRGTYVRPFAAGAFLTTASATSVFELPMLQLA